MKVFLIVLAVLVILVGVVLAGAWSMFGDKITAAKSVQKLEDDLYYMEYKGDYGFDEFLAQGGAATDAKMAEYITTFLSNGFWKPESKEVKKDFGCSTLAVANSAGGQLLGRNFDWKKDCSAIIVHTKPEKGYESISTCCLDFLGFGEGWRPEGMQNQYMALAAIYVPLDGMNEKGLCVADLISGDEAEIHQDTDKADLTIVSAIRLLLDKASTVDEAIALLQQYDMNSSIGRSHHLTISDASGKTVVVEYIDNEMVVTETAVVTNHYLSAGEKFGVGNEESHARFDKLTAMRSEANGIMETEALKDCLANVSYQNITQWSIVYDMEALALDFYWQRQYDQPHHFEVK